MIVVTGAAGFIGSVLAGRLNAAGFENLVLVDDFSKKEKEKKYQKKKELQHYYIPLKIQFFNLQI